MQGSSARLMLAAIAQGSQQQIFDGGLLIYSCKPRCRIAPKDVVNLDSVRRLGTQAHMPPLRKPGKAKPTDILLATQT